MNNDDVATSRRRLVRRLREALLAVLTEGGWKQIEDDHRKVELPWRLELGPGSGKPRYVGRVLDELHDEEVIAVARRALDRLTDRPLLDVEDALFWIDADGVAGISEVTRIALANALDGRRLHPSENPVDVLGRFARTPTSRFEYTTKGELVEVKTNIFGLFSTGGPKEPTLTKSSHLALLDSCGFRSWPDARLVKLLEFLVHPTVRRDDEQGSLVQVLNTVLAADRLELIAGEQLSGHPVFTVRPATGGVSGRPKNLIFASTGPKPELGFADAVNNDIVILRHAEHCLVYDDTIGSDGLRWLRLVE